MFEDHREVQVDEYETDSDKEETDNEDHLELVKRTCITQSGGAFRSFVRLDLLVNNTYENQTRVHEVEGSCNLSSDKFHTLYATQSLETR